MKAGYGKTVRPVCAADGGQLSLGASSDPTPMWSGARTMRGGASKTPSEGRQGRKVDA